jgi:hypothetical protein
MEKYLTRMFPEIEKMNKKQMKKNLLIDNKLIDDIKIKISDMGLCKLNDNICDKYSLQPVAYRAPEIILKLPYDNKIDTWDYPWSFACWIQNGLTILPNVNLVSNIGFGEDGTHKISSKSPLANLPVEEIIFPQKHPPFLIRHIQADNYTQNNFLNPNLLIRLRNKLKKALLNHSR